MWNDLFPLDGFTAVTHEENFLNSLFGDIHYEIHVPQGTGGYYIRNLSSLKTEEETLLARDLRVRVKSVEFSSGQWRAKVVIEIEPPQPGPAV